MSFRTNRKTRGLFRVSVPIKGHIKNIPAETLKYCDVAKALGVKCRFERRNLSSLKWRGYPFGEELVDNNRMVYIRTHINEMPFIVVRGPDNDIVDGNHRYRVFKKLGIKRVNVLAISGSKEALSHFEDFVQDYNNTLHSRPTAQDRRSE